MRTTRDAPRRDATEALSAGETASLMLAVCGAGLAAREREACLGGEVVRTLKLHLPGDGNYCRQANPPPSVTVVSRPPGSARLRYARVAAAVVHLRAGHDDGCHGFGVSLRELGGLATSLAPPGAAGFLSELFGDVAAQLARLAPWDPGEASETLTRTVGTRLTPTPLRPESLAAVREVLTGGNGRAGTSEGFCSAHRAAEPLTTRTS